LEPSGETFIIAIMSAQLFTFCLFLLWLGVTLTAFVIGPIAYPKIFENNSRMTFIGAGAGLLTLWNFVKWWTLRMRAKSTAYENQLEVTPLRGPRLPDEREKPVINPEFRFDDDGKTTRVPPPPPPNGKGH
jgi:hypothetical protein